MSNYLKIKSYLFRLDNLKVKKNKYFKKLLFFIALKLINLYRWVKSYRIYKSCGSLDEFFSSINIKWYGGNEGHTQQVEEETLFLEKLSKNSKKILEVGFNGGHSAETFLKSNKNVTVTSVDIGFHHYVNFGYFYLRKKYKNRIKLHIGDSTKVLPKLISKKYQFDLIFIDGGHEYQIVKSDLDNSVNLSDNETTIIVDDVFLPTNDSDKKFIDSHNNGPSQAWNEVVMKNKINQVDYKEFKSKSTNKRSIVVGKVK
tara:strand:- start:6092 stop:6862 length:771 start_codon:yes stop_codon:yes gene_type:complete